MQRSSETRFVAFDTLTGGLLGRILGLAIGVATLGAAIFVGAVFLAALIGFALIGAATLMLRTWWLRRQLRQAAKATGDLEGEFTVVNEEHLKINNQDTRRP